MTAEPGVKQLEDDQLRLRLARYITRPGKPAWMYEGDGSNRSGSRESLEVAVASHNPYFVEVAPGVLAVDVDEPSLAAALWTLKAELVHAGEAPVVLASGGSGRLHLFACLGSDFGGWEMRTRALGLEVRRFIRPPGTPHRAGGVSLPLDPPSWSLVAGALWRPPRSSVPSRIWSLVKEGAPRGQRSEVIQSVALSMVNHGWSFHEFCATLTSSRNALSEKVLEKRPAHRMGYLAHTWENAISFARISPAIRESRDANRELDRIQAASACAPWPTRSDKRNRRVIQAILELAYEAGGPHLSFSHRQIAERSGVTRRTADRALRDLETGGWLKCLKKGRGQTASEWRLRIPSLVRSYATSTFPSGGCVASGVGGVDRFTPAQDAFRHGFLGTIALELARTLDQEMGQTVTALAARIDRSWGGTKGALQRMERAGMARRDGKKLWYGLEVDLDTVARRLGAAGIGLRQREQHQRDRDGYAEYRAKLMEDRKHPGPRPLSPEGTR